MSHSSPTAGASGGTEREKMLRGELYDASDPEFDAPHHRCAAAVAAFNNAPPDLPRRERVTLQNKILDIPPPPPPPTPPPTEDAAADPDPDPDLQGYPYIVPPVMVEYGTQLRVAAGSFINCNCCFIDCAAITIGARVLIGPNVSFYTATHPVDPRVRNGMQGPEYALPIIVEDDVWVGGSVVICPGVVLGKGCVVGAGSVVTKNVEQYTVVAGNPARMLRRIDISQPP